MDGDRVDWGDPGAAEHVIANCDAVQGYAGNKSVNLAFAVTKALEDAGFHITRYPGELPVCPMNFPPDRCPGCRAVLAGLPHSTPRMQGDPTVVADEAPK